ncbi:MAG: hypothetical protein OEV60_06025 [Actinomycetota bacterium]|nr:hypothetical protein [Actinomycetota bacterium]MDH5224509.1 hypothetical protein [Actinomycetota bacterium]MDH5313060.1 hypothetical protein [Actinomycetota bacterium]
MNHGDHEPGTMQECPECRALAVEPGWYKLMREERVVSRRGDRVIVPDAGVADPEVVLTEVPERPDVEVLDLERAEREE